MPDHPKLADVVNVLSRTYTDQGVMIWLTAKNKQLGSCSPADYIRMGFIGAVYEAACRIDGGP